MSLPDRRQHPRFTAWLPLRLKVIGGLAEPNPSPLVTQNISKTGLCFPAPRRIEPGQSIEVEVTFLNAGPDGNNVYISSAGYIVRAVPTKEPGWYTLAAAFDKSPSDEDHAWHNLVATYDRKL
jgi:PilZ domain